MNKLNKAIKLFVSAMMIVSPIGVLISSASVIHAEEKTSLQQNVTQNGAIRLEFKAPVVTGFKNGKFTYEMRGVSDITFLVIARNPIYVDNELRYNEGDVVAMIGTDENGIAQTVDELPEGDYTVVQRDEVDESGNYYVDEKDVITTTVRHAEIGHYKEEKTLVKEAWDEELWVENTKYICNDCNQEFNMITIHDHIAEELENGGKGSYRTETTRQLYDIVHHEPEYETKQVWVVDKEAWDEELVSAPNKKDVTVGQNTLSLDFYNSYKEYTIAVNSKDSLGNVLNTPYELYAQYNVNDMYGHPIIKAGELIATSHYDSATGMQIFDTKIPGDVYYAFDNHYYVKAKGEAGLLNTDSVGYITTTGDTNKVVDMTLDCTKLKIEINKGEDANFDKVNYELILEDDPSVSYVGEGGTNDIYLNNLVPGKYILHLKKLGYKDLIETVIINNVNNLHYFEYQMEKISGQWVLDGDSWWYQFEDGSYPKNTIYMIDNKEYLFDMWGWMSTGWVQYNNEWYYCDNSGVMQKNWQYINNNWYYFNESGKMTTGWQLLGNQWYYLDENGSMVTGWQYINDNWYYFDESGCMTSYS